MSFSGAFADFADRAGVEVHPVLEIDLEHSATWNGVTITDLYLSDAAINARGLNYDPRIVTGGWGTVTREIDLRASGLQGANTEVTVADIDNQLRNLLITNNQRNSPAVIRRVIQNNTDDYATVFSGVLDAWEFKPGQVVLKLKTDESALHSFWPAWPYLKSEWYNMQSDFIGSFIPILYGKHDSTGLSNAGMLPTTPVRYVAGVVGWYAVAIGAIAEIKTVYKNGAVAAPDNLYPAGIFSGGKVFSLVEFLGANTPADGDEITVDAYGYQDGAWTAGVAPIMNPVRQMRHFLCNFAVNRSKGYGAWVYTASIIDGTSWDAAEAWADAHGLEGSRYIGGSQRQVLDIFNEWLASWPAFRAYWNSAGAIALEILSPDWPGYWDGTSSVLMKENDIDASCRYELDADDITGRISVSYLFDEAQSKYLRTLTVQDLSVNELSDSSYDLPWSTSSQA